MSVNAIRFTKIFSTESAAIAAARGFVFEPDEFEYDFSADYLPDEGGQRVGVFTVDFEFGGHEDTEEMDEDTGEWWVVNASPWREAMVYECVNPQHRRYIDHCGRYCRSESRRLDDV